MTLIPGVQALQLSLPQPDVEFLQQKRTARRLMVSAHFLPYGPVSRVV